MQGALRPKTFVARKHSKAPRFLTEEQCANSNLHYISAGAIIPTIVFHTCGTSSQIQCCLALLNFRRSRPTLSSSSPQSMRALLPSLFNALFRYNLDQFYSPLSSYSRGILLLSILGHSRSSSYRSTHLYPQKHPHLFDLMYDIREPSRAPFPSGPNPTQRCTSNVLSSVLGVTTQCDRWNGCFAITELEKNLSQRKLWNAGLAP